MKSVISYKFFDVSVHLGLIRISFGSWELLKKSKLPYDAVCLLVIGNNFLNGWEVSLTSDNLLFSDYEDHPRIRALE